MTVDWLQEYRGATVVVKFGGNAMVDDALGMAFAEDIVALHKAGVRIVVTHGGGPQISAELTRRGIASEFRGGLRYTSSEAVLAVRDVLVALGTELAGRITAAGGSAVAVPGHEGTLFTAVRTGTIVDSLPVDLGRVGEVTAVDPGSLTAILDGGGIPVVSAVATEVGQGGEGGELLNVNADSAAASIAVALGAERLILLTDVAGLYRDWPNLDSLISTIDTEELSTMLPSLQSGMIPKMLACHLAVGSGVAAAVIVDGRVPHVLTAAPFGVSGTTVLPTERVAS